MKQMFLLRLTLHCYGAFLFVSTESMAQTNSLRSFLFHFNQDKPFFKVKTSNLMKITNGSCFVYFLND
jgi:hypothetical protein